LGGEAGDQHPHLAAVLGVELLEAVLEVTHVARKTRGLERDLAAPDDRRASLAPDPGGDLGL
jgi:hypothetical protein